MLVAGSSTIRRMVIQVGLETIKVLNIGSSTIRRMVIGVEALLRKLDRMS